MRFCSPFSTRYTFSPKEGRVNAIFLNWPVSGTLELGEPQAKLGETQVKDNTPPTPPLSPFPFRTVRLLTHSARNEHALKENTSRICYVPSVFILVSGIFGNA